MLAVLPFENMSGDPEQECVVDDLIDNVTTALSHIRTLFVIACNSAFTYEGKPPEGRRVGRELDVRYVLEGSVRNVGLRALITRRYV